MEAYLALLISYHQHTKVAHLHCYTSASFNFHLVQKNTMGSLSPLNQEDLKVKVQQKTLIFPAQKTERKSMFLSNIDKVLNFNVDTVHFFQANPDFPPEIVVEKLKNALQELLVPYDFLGGRWKFNHETMRPEFDCNDAGVGFVVAISDCELNDIGDLMYPNPDFAQLVTHDMGTLDDKPLCIAQLSHFKCGGFVLGMSISHAAFDGLSFKIFLQNLAAVASGKPLAVVPCNDRELLAARSPPLVAFEHPELLKLKVPIGEEEASTKLLNASNQLDFKIFHLDRNDIAKLKEKGKPQSSTGKPPNTGFNVVTAHVWRCKALSNLQEDNENRLATILYSADIRPRLNPPLPPSYTGNAILTAYATASCKELEKGPFSKLVSMVSEGATRMTDEYARSLIDWGEIYQGFPHGEFLVSSWWRLGFDQIEYPWGKPRYNCPVVYRRNDIVLLFPDINEGNNGGSVNILVALPHKEMEKFETLFHEFLA